jgi:hypothetical protein
MGTVRACAVALALSCVVTSAPSAGSWTGVYDDELSIAVDTARNLVTGYYESYTGWDEVAQAPRFSCIFFLSGSLREGRAQIASWYPGDTDVIYGTLVPGRQDTTTAVTVTLESEHGGCHNVMHFATDGGATMHRTKVRDWIALRVAKAERAYFHTEPDGSTKRRAYVVAGDLVGVTDRTDGWVFAEYRGKKVTRGWIREQDLYPVAAPDVDAPAH